MSLKVTLAVFFCGIYLCSAMAMPTPTVPQHIYLPTGDDKTNWADVWKATNTSGVGRGGGSTQNVNGSSMEIIIGINAKERGSGIQRSGDNRFLFEGDIAIDRNEAIQIIQGQSRRRRAVMKNRGSNLWPKSGVPYIIDRSVSHVQNQIRGGIRAWEKALPCMAKWKDYTRYTASAPSSLMYFFLGGGCYSQVGRVGNRQRVSIGRGCEHHGVVVHEIGHAMGLWHEQSRPDRDGYVTILWNNIVPAMRFNFQKYTDKRIDSLQQGYDYNSVMHYGAYAFARYRGQRTIQSKRANTRLGQRNGLSSGDIKQVQILYGCTTKTTTKPLTKKPPPPSGCQDINSNCNYWKGKGYCAHSYVTYMKKNCCKSCSCKDKQSAKNCIYWKGKSYCNNSSRWAGYMKKNCCKTCKA